MYRVLTSFLSLLYLTAIRANAQDATLISTAAPTTTFSTDVLTTDFASLISSEISSELASLYPSTNPYARACLTYDSVVDKCNLVLATLTAPAAVESAATSCYCEISSSMHNGAFDAILSSCEIYLNTAHLFTTSRLTETYTALSTPSASSVSLLSFSSPTSIASALTSMPKSLVCNGPAATATATGGTNSTPTAGAAATSGESAASGSSASAASSKASAAAANALPVGDLKTSFGALVLGLFTFLRLL